MWKNSAQQQHRQQQLRPRHRQQRLHLLRLQHRHRQQRRQHPPDGTPVSAPMPGTILDVKCKAGDSVTKGQVLFVLEAMKMENDIVAPEDGTVLAVNTTKGSSVNPGDALAVLG